MVCLHKVVVSLDSAAHEEASRVSTSSACEPEISFSQKKDAEADVRRVSVSSWQQDTHSARPSGFSASSLLLLSQMNQKLASLGKSERRPRYSR